MSTLPCRRDGAIAHIALTKPGRAALTRADIVRLAEAIELADHDPHCRVVVMSGPSGTFCAGGDIADFLGCDSFDELEAAVRRLFQALVRLDKPLIAAVDGAAIGLGATMLLHCDAVFASPDSTFSAPFVDLGLVPEAGSTLLAPARFGRLRAFDMFCLGRVYSAFEAEVMGLISQVTPVGQTLERAREVAARLSRQPLQALMATKRLLRGEPTAVLARIDDELTRFRAQLEDSYTARRLAKISRRDRQAA